MAALDISDDCWYWWCCSSLYLQIYSMVLSAVDSVDSEGSRTSTLRALGRRTTRV